MFILISTYSVAAPDLSHNLLKKAEFHDIVEDDSWSDIHTNVYSFGMEGKFLFASIVAGSV